MSDLLNNIYLPDFEKREVRESDAYKLFQDNKMDTSILEGYEQKANLSPVILEDFDGFINQGGTKEDWIAKHATPEVQKEFFSNVADFIVDTGKDTVLSLATAVINGADVATNLAPLFAKALDKMPLVTGMPNGFMTADNEKQIYDTATNVSNNLGKAREYLNEFKKDDNFVSQLVGVMSQDLLYSMPIYNSLKKAGVPKYPAFFISGGIGGAIGIEDKIMGNESTFAQEFFEKDIVGLKNLIGILPNTPEEFIADEVVQALEYGAFSTAIPGIIDAFKFMKRYIPAMTATTAGTTALTIDNEAEGNPLKAIVNAVSKVPVFKSAVKTAVETKITKGAGEQIYNTIKNTPGVKENELKWIGLEGFLKDKKNVTQQEILEFIEANRLDVNERKFGNFVDTPEKLKSKSLVDYSDKEIRKIQDNIYEEIEKTNHEGLRYVSDHLDYLREAKHKRIDNFKIKKTQYAEGIDAPDITDQNYNFGSFMNEYNLYGAVNGLDDDMSGAIGQYYFDTTFGDHYLIHAIKSKSTKNLLTDNMEKQLYDNFSSETTLPEQTIKNSDTHNGFHVQSDEFENFKKYLDNNGAYISNHIRYEIPKDQRVAVFNEMNIRSNEEMYATFGDGGDDLMEALGQFTDTAFMPKSQYDQYTSAGGENYSELVLTLSKGGDNVGGNFPLETNVTKQGKIEDFGIKSSPHFGASGEIAHVRFKTRTLTNGKKVLAVEEMQSDLVQSAKQRNIATLDNAKAETEQAMSLRQTEENNFKNITDADIEAAIKETPPDDLIKDFPFKNTWYEMTIKRLIRYAADNGFDAISIPKASVIQDRYNLTKRVDNFNIRYFDDMRKEVGLMARDQNGVTQIDEIYTFDRIEKEFGKDVLNKVIKKGPAIDDDAKKIVADYKSIINETDEYPNIKLDKKIEIGGEGKSNLYNKGIPSFIKKYGKKWNAKVYDDEVDTGLQLVNEGIASTSKIPVTVLELTSEMKNSVQQTSQPLFELFGGIGLSTWGAKAVSDNMKNNIISQTTN